jgi:serine/threonine protein kinase
MPVVSACPDQQMLERLALGKLDPEVVEPLARHCEQCTSCIQALQSLRAADTLMAVLAAHGDPSESASARAISALLARLKSGRSQDSGMESRKPPVPRAEKQSTLQPSAMHTAASISPGKPEVAGTPVALDFLAPPQAADEIGRLGHYRVLKVLGQGGMGVVFQAEDPRLSRLCALKVMLAEVARRPDMKDRFLREARAAAQIENDHIVPIYEVNEDRGVPFIAMPFLKGSTLEDWMRQKQHSGTPITVANILKLAREMAKGLSVAHAHGLIHRDIKPANIWLDSTMGGRVKILDFGLARLSGSGEEKNLTQSGMIMGTPAYMAPEQAQGKKDLIDGRTDLFSLGCILYRLCTGAEPFHGEDMISTLVAVATENPTPPSHVNPAIPQRLSDLVMQLLAKKSDERPESAKEVVKSIVQMEKDLAAGALPAANALAAISQRAVDRAAPSKLPVPKPPLSKPPAVSAPPPEPAALSEIALSKKRRRKRAVKRRSGIPVVAIALAALGGLALVVAGVVVFWETPKGTVRVEIHDPSIRAAIDQEEFTIQGAGNHDIGIRTGDHTLHIKYGNLEFETDKFILKKNDTVTLKVELLSGKVQVVHDNRVIGERAVASRVPQPAPTPDPNEKSASQTASSTESNKPSPSIPPDSGKPPSIPPPPPSQPSVLYDVHFSDPNSGWRLFKNQLQDIGYDQGRYFVSVIPKGMAGSASPKNDFLPFACTVVGRITGSPAGNWILMVQNLAEKRGLYFKLNGKQQLTVTSRETQNGQVQKVVRGPVKNNAIKPRDEFNKLLVIARTGKFEIFVNDLKVGEPIASDMVKFPAKLSLAAESVDDKAVRAEWESFKVEPADKVAAVEKPAEKSQYEVRRFDGHTGEVVGLAVAPNGKQALSGSRDRTVRLWDIASGAEVRRFTAPEAIESVALSPDGSQALFGTETGVVFYWDVANWKEVRRFKAHTSVIRDVAFFPDGKRAFSASIDQTCASWNLAEGKEIKRVTDGDAQAFSGVLFPDGKRAIVSYHDGNFRIWDMESGQMLNRVHAQNDWAVAVALSADGKLAVTSSGDKEHGLMHVWDLENMNKILDLPGRGAKVEAVAFTRDGLRVLSGGFDNTLRLWNAKTGQELAHLEGHTSVIRRVIVLPSDELVMTASADRTIRLWRIPKDK